MFLNLLEGTVATSSRIRLLELQNRSVTCTLSSPILLFASSPYHSQKPDANKWVLLGYGNSLYGQCFLLSSLLLRTAHVHMPSLRNFLPLLLNPTSHSQFNPSNVQKAVYSLEVEGETGVVSLDEDSRRSLDGLCPDSTLLMRTDCELRENYVRGEDG